MAAQSSSASSVLVSFIECLICNEQFDDHKRCPIFLDCGHTLCNECIEKMKKPLHESSAAAAASSSSSSSSGSANSIYVVTCPLHNAVHSIIGKNWHIISALSDLSERENKRSETGPKGKQCGKCDVSPAMIYCEQCDDDICGKCDSLLHGGSGKWSAHQRYSMNEKEMHAVPRCEKHPQERVAYYCHHCKKTVCHRCKDAKAHCKESPHHVESIEDVRDQLVIEARDQLSLIAPAFRSHADNLLCAEEMDGAVKHWGARMMSLVYQTIDAFQNEYKQYVGDSEAVRKSYSISAAKGESYVLEAERLLNTIQPKNAKESKYETAAAVRQLQLVLQNLDTAKSVESEELKSFKDRFLSIKFLLNRTQELRGGLSKEIDGLGSILKGPNTLIDSIIIKDPNIVCQLFSGEKVGKKFELLYRGTRDGFGSSAFHSKCDNKGATLTIIQTTKDEVIGGYSSIAWNSHGQTVTNGTVWIYALTNNKRNKKNGKNEQEASGDAGIVKLFPAGYNGSYNGYTWSLIYGHANYGPVFGYCSSYGADLGIVSTNMQYTSFSYRRQFFNIASPSGSSFPSNLSGFSVKEIEVFHVE